MKTILYTLTILIPALCCSYTFAATENETNKDTVIINLDNDSKIIVYVSELSNLDDIEELDLNALIKKISRQNDSISGDTALQINLKETGQNNKSELTFELEAGNDRLSMKIKTRDQEGENIEIRLDEAMSDLKKALEDLEKAQKELRKYQITDTLPKEKTTEKETEVCLYDDRDQFSGYIALGFNNYLENKGFPDESGAVYGLRPWGSRYFGMGLFYNKFRLGKESRIFIKPGIEFAWNNFMFNGNNRIMQEESEVIFEADSINNLKKSKLTTAYFNIPIQLEIDLSKFKNRNGLFIGLGAYGGYRLGSHSKVVFYDEGEKIKDKLSSNFFLNNWRYGVMGKIGYDWFSLFARYDISELFKNNRGPALNTFSFGLMIE